MGPCGVHDQGRQAEQALQRSLCDVDMLDPVERDNRVGAPEKAAQHPQLLVAHVIAPAAVDAAGQQAYLDQGDQRSGYQHHARRGSKLYLQCDFCRQCQSQQDQ